MRALVGRLEKQEPGPWSGREVTVLTCALRAATKTAAAVREGGNCRMGSSARAWVARAKAHPAASLTVSPLLKSTFSRCRYICRAKAARHQPDKSDEVNCRQCHFAFKPQICPAEAIEPDLR